ncbi:hypothetical protein AGOR_G00008020 [Albula goreensis]|uniref:Uncharacterized protein n=1 Tax=Albula goreensis TaxID=1534307 RepID=A0A8T3E912_9TELE|nr:hypothetical protein AGOR_G00008020 [Albula goreensis]
MGSEKRREEEEKRVKDKGAATKGPASLPGSVNGQQDSASQNPGQWHQQRFRTLESVSREEMVELVERVKNTRKVLCTSHLNRAPARPARRPQPVPVAQLRRERPALRQHSCPGSPDRRTTRKN